MGSKPNVMFSIKNSLVCLLELNLAGFHRPPFTHHPLEQLTGGTEVEGEEVGRFVVVIMLEKNGPVDFSTFFGCYCILTSPS